LTIMTVSDISHSSRHSMQLFWERLSEKLHATIVQGIVGGFEYTILQRNLREWHERPWTYICKLLTESNKSRYDSCSVRNGVLIISHITFRDCRMHIFSDNLSRNSCMSNHFFPEWIYNMIQIDSGKTSRPPHAWRLTSLTFKNLWEVDL